MRLFPLCGLLLLAISPLVPFPAQAATGGRGFNPDISVNFLGLARYGTAYSNDRSASPHNGLTLQEAEMQFLSDVDPYFRASALFALEQEEGEVGYGIDPEEVFLETISLPVVTVRAGKFKMALGRHNQLHTHAFPFIDAPLINQRLLGDEGLNESGISVAALLPLPWYSELTLQGMALSNEELLASRSSGDFGALAHFKNLWDLSDSSTLELGLSGLTGNNQFGKKSSVVGADLTVKWRPTVGGKYHALVWSTEYLLGERNGFTADRDDPSAPGSTLTESTKELGGLATWLQYQFAERWWAQARYEYEGLPRSPTPSLAKVDKQSALLAFLPSEFSGLRLQYDRIHDRARPRVDHAVAFQYNVTIGAHPAHAY